MAVPKLPEGWHQQSKTLIGAELINGCGLKNEDLSDLDFTDSDLTNTVLSMQTGRIIGIPKVTKWLGATE